MAGLNYNALLKNKIQSTIINYVLTENVIHIFHQYDFNVLTDIDIQYIQAEANNKGKKQGTIVLLDRLARYENWFECLTNVLKDPEVKLHFVAAALENMKANLDHDLSTQLSRVSPVTPDILARSKYVATASHPSLVDTIAVSDFQLSPNVGGRSIETDVETDAVGPVSRDVTVKNNASKEQPDSSPKDGNLSEVQQDSEPAASAHVDCTRAVSDDEIKEDHVKDESNNSLRHKDSSCGQEGVLSECAPPLPAPADSCTPPLAPSDSRIPTLPPADNSRIPTPAPAESHIPTPAPAESHIPTPVPVDGHIPTRPPAESRISTPAPAESHIPVAPAESHIPTPAPAESRIPTLAPAENRIPTLAPAESRIPTLAPAESCIPTLAPAESQIPTPAPAESQIPTPAPAESQIPTPTPAESRLPTLAPAESHIPTPAPADKSRIPVPRRGSKKASGEAPKEARPRPVFSPETEWDYYKEEVTTALGSLPGWHSDFGEKDVWRVLKPVMNEDGWYLVWYHDFDKKPIISVTDRKTVIGIKVGKQHDRKDKSKVLFYIFKAEKKMDSLLDLVQYHLTNGVQDTSEHSDHRLILFKRPVLSEDTKG